MAEKIAKIKVYYSYKDIVIDIIYKSIFFVTPLILYAKLPEKNTKIDIILYVGIYFICAATFSLFIDKKWRSTVIKNYKILFFRNGN